MNTQAASMKVKGIDELDIDLLHKQFELLAKADEAFKNHHKDLYEQNDDMEENQFLEELQGHQSAVSDVKQKLQVLVNRYEAHELIGSMEEALEAMERSSGRPYSSSRETELERVERLVWDFRTASSKKGAIEDPDLKVLRYKAIDRLQVLQEEVETSWRAAKALDVREASPIKEISGSSKAPKTKFPTFDGSILKWRDFWELFSTLIKKYPTMDDTEKNLHLVQAMGDDEAKRNAEKAVALSNTYDEAVRRLKHIYERNRIVHTRHLTELWKKDCYSKKRKDLKRGLDRLQMHKRGLNQAKGYTADQMVAARFEELMDHELVSEWRKYTAKDVQPPTALQLEAFFEEQIDQAPDDPAELKDREARPKRRQSPRPSAKTVLHTQPSGADKCSVCAANHVIYSCPQFKDKTPQQR